MYRRMHQSRGPFIEDLQREVRRREKAGLDDPQKPLREAVVRARQEVAVRIYHMTHPGSKE